jgi:glycosyltransferase involved in cell wall biosynthesis
MTTYEVLMPLAPWENPNVLTQALESIRWQTLPAARIVVSCDGTPPADLLAVLEGSGLPIELLIGPGTEGVGPVLARGLLACRSEFVLRADSDDLSLPERGELQIRAMQAQPDVAAMSAPIIEFIHESGLPSGIRKVPVESGRILSWSRWRNPMNHPAVVLRRSAILRAGNYRYSPGFEDYDLWLRLIRCLGTSSLANLSVPLVHARVGAEHLSRRRGFKYVKEEVRFLIRCGSERLLSWPQLLLIAALRVPTRLLPARILLIAMSILRTPAPHA